MSEMLSSVISLYTFVILVTLAFISYVYEDEQAVARSIHVQVMKEMAGSGYLDPVVSAYYSKELEKEGLSKSTGAYFSPSHKDPSNRAMKPVYSEVDPKKNFVQLETRIKPSFTTVLINWLRTGNGDFHFINERESQYIPFKAGG
ncbi:hypothetical protein POF51_26325 [Brevibacillus sp. AG]|uniref:hypothetical protein n=1 Tax=Brevibacillus sp. AG TaxID=3020891 RepID=UPI00232D034F|nr:hypothetical protein [Brevibacillus sp. AG]MDC0764240.1 hypothetical protein [Brevibacillus sp. AG]